MGCNEDIGVFCKNDGECVDGVCDCYVDHNYNFTTYVGNHCENIFMSGEITTTYYDDVGCYTCPTSVLNADTYSNVSAYSTTVYLNNGNSADELFIQFDQYDPDDYEYDERYGEIGAYLATHNKYSNENGHQVLVQSTSDCISLDNITKDECNYRQTQLEVFDISNLNNSATVSGTLYFNNNGGQVMYEAFEHECVYKSDMTSYHCDTSYKRDLTYALATIDYTLTFIPDTKTSFNRRY